jgi:sulfhydrogenase subunit gamma (sulfur reductase)
MTPVQIYTPYAARLQELRVETRDVKTLRLVFQDAKIAEGFSFRPGQFVELSVAGEGEATFCLASSPEERGYVECSVKRVGLVTEAIHRLDPNALVGLRGPYGNSFPLEQMEGRNLVFVAGGIGLAALRSLIKVVLAEPQKYGSILILYGARSVADLVYLEELEQWRSRKDLKTVLTVDPGGESADWKGEVGFVPAVLERLNPGRKNTTVITCGPPIMIRYVLAALDRMGFDPEAVITTLEMKMKCGLGKCGRCNVGPLYVCKDGPVFTYAQIREFVEQII